MSYSERVELYREIEKDRGCPLLCYVTNSRPGALGQMASDTIPEFARQLVRIPEGYKQIDILIVSSGGDPTVAWRVISMLRERFERIGVLLPYAAYSAATLLALGADEIVMHPFSNLGPVDAQLSRRRSPGGPDQQDSVETLVFGAEDLRHYLDFVRTDVGISDQEQLQRAFELVCKEVGAISIGMAKRSSYLGLSMGEKLLGLHMKDTSKAAAIAEVLNKSFYHHGYPVGREEAKQIGLSVKEPNAGLEELMWQVWEDIEEEMECSKPFNPLEVALGNDEISKLIEPVPQVQLPANLPQPVLQQTIKNILQQIPIVSVPPVDYELFQATLESVRCRSEFRTKGLINAVRLPDMKIAVNMVKVTQGWVFSEEKEEGE